MQPFHTATLYIVGAGPGDPELITLKAMKVLQQADVILYDPLVSKELLLQARLQCRLIAVEKQEAIHHLITLYAVGHTCIVRLKDDDPFASGRGHEELEYALRQGIRAEVIPGISRALAVPASVGIPLTKRGVNESFWVVIGSDGSGEMSADLFLAARSSATVIILRGMAHLNAITRLFQKTRSASEPVAVIQQATGQDQKITVGTANSIVAQVDGYAFTSHDMIVIGKVVQESTPNALHAQVAKLTVAV